MANNTYIGVLVGNCGLVKGQLWEFGIVFRDKEFWQFWVRQNFVGVLCRFPTIFETQKRLQKMQWKMDQ